jgi:hypothetical protein
MQWVEQEPRRTQVQGGGNEGDSDRDGRGAHCGRDVQAKPLQDRGCSAFERSGVGASASLLYSCLETVLQVLEGISDILSFYGP